MAAITMRPNLRDYTGTRSGTFTALNAIGVWNGGQVMWLSQCDCGIRQTIAAADLDQHRIKRCQCGSKKSKVKKYDTNGAGHGHRGNKNNKTRTYRSWAGLVSRCQNPKEANYKWYGAIGIAVCERWRKFENFLEDMGERPDGKSLDRWPDPYGNYEPGNCRWATPLQQTHNQRRRDKNGNFLIKNSDVSF